MPDEPEFDTMEQAIDALKAVLATEGHFLDGSDEPGMPEDFRTAEAIYIKVVEFLQASTVRFA
jgi:hypothetical protein